MDDEASELEALEHIMCDANAEPIKLSYGLLRSITDNFSTEIGRGGFGAVYQGVLQNGDVAVKKLLNLHALPENKFLDEITCLKKSKNKNIVRFLGYCSESQGELLEFNGKNVLGEAQQKLLCFEYVPNGNIKHYLQQGKFQGDDWPLRYKMIRGICQGLHFLHGERISHLDLKPENVMLDTHMEPKITDFGLSRFIDQGQSKVITQNIAGTLRYIAPETIDHGEISFKSDIYALGIIIIELLNGTSMTSLENWDESLDLLDCPRARMCAKIARNCTDAKKDNRPTMHEVIHCIDEVESTIPESSTTNQLFPGVELLDVYPRGLRFVCHDYNGHMRCSLTMANKTDSYVMCVVHPKDPETPKCGIMELLPQMSSSVSSVDINVGQELPSNMVEWQILMFTTALCGDLNDIIDRINSALEGEVYSTDEDKIKALHAFFGGELHRAALTASVVVDSDVKPETHPLELEVDHCAIHSMEVHPTEPWVLAMTHDKLYIWNWQTNEKVGLRNKETCDELNSVAKFITREQWVVTGDDDGVISVLTCPTLDRVNRFETHGGKVSLLAVHPTRPFLLSFGDLPLLKLWDWSSDWSCTGIFDIKSSLKQVMFNPRDTNTFATRGTDRLVKMWKIGHLNSIATTHSGDGREGGRGFTYIGNRDCIASIDRDRENISIWDLRKGKHVYTLRSENCRYFLAVCHPTRPILVTVSRNRRLEVWDSTTYRVTKAYDNLADKRIYVGFTSRRLVVGYSDGVSVLDIDLE